MRKLLAAGSSCPVVAERRGRHERRVPDWTAAAVAVPSSPVLGPALVHDVDASGHARLNQGTRQLPLHRQRKRSHDNAIRIACVALIASCLFTSRPFFVRGQSHSLSIHSSHAPVS